MALTQEQQDTLESILDSATLEDVFDSPDNICYEKANHLRTNWQEEAMGKAWEKAGAKVGGISHSAAVMHVS